MIERARQGDEVYSPEDLVENVPSRPFLKPSVRRLGDIRLAATEVDILRQEQRAAIVNAAKKKSQLRKVEFTGVVEAGLIDRVYAAFEEFFSDWRSRLSEDDELAIRAIESIDHALAALIGSTISFATEDDDGNDIEPPFWSEESAFQWLQDGLHDPDEEILSADDFFNTDSFSREINHLWLARQFLVAKHEDIYASLDAADDMEVTPRVYTSARLASNIQQLIGDLCEAWTSIDPDVGLPDASSSPDNPLLRYIDACLAVVLGDQRPGKKAVLNFVKTQWKPNHWRKFDEPELPFKSDDVPEEFPF